MWAHQQGNPVVWEPVTAAEGEAAVMEMMKTGTGLGTHEGTCVETLLLTIHERFAHLMKSSIDALELIDGDMPEQHDEIFSIRNGVIHLLTSMQEELLSVLDDQSVDNLDRWLCLWRQSGRSIMCGGLDDAMLGKMDDGSVLNAKRAEIRRAHLILLRGLQSLIGSSDQLRLLVVHDMCEYISSAKQLAFLPPPRPSMT